MRFNETIILLEREEREARNKFNTLVYQRRDADANATRAAARIINMELERIYGPTTRYLSAELSGAQERLTKAQDAAAQAGEGAPAPLGTVYYFWDTVREYDSVKRVSVYVRRITDKRAVLESIRPDSQHAENADWRNHAKVGQYVLRLRKKDGTPSKKYVMVTSEWRKTNEIPAGWYAEGHVPISAVQQ